MRERSSSDSIEERERGKTSCGQDEGFCGDHSLKKNRVNLTSHLLRLMLTQCVENISLLHGLVLCACFCGKLYYGPRTISGPYLGKEYARTTRSVYARCMQE